MAAAVPIGVSPIKVRLLDAAPDLGENLDPHLRERARTALVVSVLHAQVGGWNPPELARGSTGLLVLDGFLIRSFAVGRNAACELLGPGDLLRPWDDGQLEEHFLPARADWRVQQTARFAVLDRSTAVLMNRWPALTDEVITRFLRRTRSLTYLLAIHRFSRVEDRLLRTLWHLASLWGRVRPDGIVIPVAMSHEILGQLIAASRPSVTLAVSCLERRNLLARDEARRFVLRGAPPASGIVDTAGASQPA
jgi:hypothetical protein